MPHQRCHALALLSLSATLPWPLSAQEDAAEPAETSASSQKRSFLPADFERFAPRTAYDMLSQLPSFTIRSADDERGLGQASENVLINGQRITDKSGGAIERLRNIPAKDVQRIEIGEAAALGIAGLTGQVANVVLNAERGASGRFEWSPRLRFDYAKPSLLRGKLSYSGTSGDFEYTLSLQDYGDRGASGGPDYVVLAPDGALIERRGQTQQYVYDNARIGALLKYGGSGPVQANLNLVYNPYLQRNFNFQRRERTDGNDNDWQTIGRTPGYSFSGTGDISFPLVGGTLKLVGLRKHQHAPLVNIQRTTFDSGAPDHGVRFARDAHTGETIARAEYRWKGGSNDWEISIERADNSLGQQGALAILQPDGSYEDVDFPAGSGIVNEKRYEGIASLSRPLGARLDLQLVGGAEYSRLRHVSRNEPAREFVRPKGSASLAWRPAPRWDASLKLERKVGQIDFYDFLSQPDLVLDRENDANPDLVPPQSWQLTGELGRDFGKWGKTRLKLYAHRIDDIVDFIPVGEDGEAVGNLPRANRLGFESVSTIQFDPLGWSGAKLDVTFGMEHSSVEDPLTGEDRPISGTRDHWASLDLRHDVAGTPFAWGAFFSADHYGSSYYLTETNSNWEGPYVGLFVEDKDVAGLKVTFEAFNILDARSHFQRTVHDGRRTVAPVVFREVLNQRVSQIFTLTVSGTF